MQTISIHAPREGGDSSANRCRSCWIHFNPRPPRGGRLQLLRSCVDYLNISIHAPREGGDLYGFAPGPSLILISIHAPREGGDLPYVKISHTKKSDFNPRPPRGGRP